MVGRSRRLWDDGPEQSIPSQDAWNYREYDESGHSDSEEDRIQQFPSSIHQASQLELNYTKLNIPCALRDQFQLRKTIQEVWANTAWFCSALDKQNPGIEFTRKNYEDIWAMAVRAAPPLLQRWGLLNSMPDAYQYIPRAITLIQGQPIMKAERSAMREQDTRRLNEHQATVAQQRVQTSSVPRALPQARLDDASRAMEQRIQAYTAKRLRQQSEALPSENSYELVDLEREQIEASANERELKARLEKEALQQAELAEHKRQQVEAAKDSDLKVRFERQALEQAEQKRQLSWQRPQEVPQARLDDVSRSMERRIQAYNAERERQEIEVLAREKEADSAKQRLGQQDQPVQQRGEARVDTKVLEARAKAKEIETRLQRQALEPAEQKRQFSRQPLEAEFGENVRIFEEAMEFPKHQLGLGRVRPETSMMTANRMIAGALGIKIPTKTETNAYSTFPKNTPTPNAEIQRENTAPGKFHSDMQQGMTQPILIKQLTFPRILLNNFQKQTDVQNIWRPIDQYIADLDRLNPKCNFSQRDYENIWAYGIRTVSNTGEFLVRFGFVANLDQARQVIEEAAVLILRTKSLKNALKKRNKTFSLFDQHGRNTTAPQGRAQAYSAEPFQDYAVNRPPSTLPSRPNNSYNAQTASGNKKSGVYNKEGTIVGASAPEIGQGNKGRAMLEKMGWSAGMGLGSENTGILDPVPVVVKHTTAGIGMVVEDQRRKNQWSKTQR